VCRGCARLCVVFVAVDLIGCVSFQFSVPKPRGGRGGDLLLSEDQMMVGVWAQRVKKKENFDSFFADTTYGAFVRVVRSFVLLCTGANVMTCHFIRVLSTCRQGHKACSRA